MPAWFVGAYAINAVNNARSATQAYYAFKTIATLDGYVPVFKDVRVAAFSYQIVPREEQQAAEITRTMLQASLDYVQRVTSHSGFELAGCVAVDCPAGPRILVGFTETGYSGNFAIRVAMGGKLRGDLRIVDARSGEVMVDVQINDVENYADVVAFINRYVGSLIASSAYKDEDTSDDTKELLVDRVNEIPAISARFKQVLENAS